MSWECSEDGFISIADSFDSEVFDAARIFTLDYENLAEVLADKDLTPAASCRKKVPRVLRPCNTF
jgi:hypothetical protein